MTTVSFDSRSTAAYARRWLLLLALLCGYAVADQTGWTLEKDEDAIRIYTRSLPDWPVRQFRGEVVIDARIESLLALLDDNASCPRWIHNCISGELLGRPDAYQKHNYMQTKAPWPVKKRDSILFTSTTVTEDRVEIIGIAKPDYRPRDRKFVRIPRQEVRWELTPLDNGSVQVIFESVFDPGGSVPDWAVNRTLIETPFNTLKNMRLLVREPEYRDTDLRL